MLYEEYLTTLNTCPFCEKSEERIIRRNELAFLTYALAPYHKHHLLVIPNRHVENFGELTRSETQSIEELLKAGTDIIEKLNYTDYSLLLRNGQK